MSNIDADLVLHLTLDEIRDGKFLDASGRKHNGVVKGNVTLVPDDTFGACASFPGATDSYIEVPDSPDLQIAGDVTLEAWVWLAVDPADWVRIIGKGASSTRNYGLWYMKGSWLFQRQRMSAQKYQDCEIPTSKLPRRLNTWYHMAAVLQGSSASLYIHDLQGQPLLPQPVKATWDGAPMTSADPLKIGYAGFVKAHNGKIANVRVYKRALSQAEIEQDIRADRMSLVAFRKSHPIDFSLYDDDEQAVLYISDDLDGRNLNLELRNTSTQAIQLSNGQNTASEANHHFALRFRPGTLSDGAIKLLTNPQERAKILKQADQWDLYFPSKPPAANETASLYLLYKGASKSFQPNERRALTLQQMSAAPGSGARGTQVELIPRQLTAAGGDATPITGSRTQYVHITNHQGKKNIPLHVGFMGSNTVLNNGKAQEKPLRLRITNVSKDGEITLNAKTNKYPSTFIVSFDAQGQGQDKEWALVRSADAQNVKVNVSIDRNLSIDKNEIKPNPPGPATPAAIVVGQLAPNPIYLGTNADEQAEKVVMDVREINPEGITGETPEWPITFDKTVHLGAGKHIQVEITGIVTSLSSGHANLYVRYENIPGYWDGQFVCAVEKGPIVIDEGEGGIGTAKPTAKVKVAGDIVAENLSVARVNERRGGVFFAMPGDFDHVIYNNLSRIDGGEAWDGANWNTGKGLRVRVGKKSQKKLAFAINENGNVGIGEISHNYQFAVSSSTPIKLGLEGNGGGQLVIANKTNDNKVYLEALSSDANGHAAEFLLTGKGGAPIPKLSLLANTTEIGGNLSLSPNSTVTFPTGCKIVGVPRIAMKRFVVTSDKSLSSLEREVYFSEVKNGMLEWKGMVDFASSVQSAEAIVSYVQSANLTNWDYNKIKTEGQYVEIEERSDNKVHLIVRIWRQYRDEKQTPQQLLGVEIVVIAILE
ncbi:MAG TPA: LamG domain-containing protein [Blastocatellia bacterium]|nr:LamG domain-containing protein [Blastocatellia bacterium]